MPSTSAATAAASTTLPQRMLAWTIVGITTPPHRERPLVRATRYDRLCTWVRPPVAGRTVRPLGPRVLVTRTNKRREKPPRYVRNGSGSLPSPPGGSESSTTRGPVAIQSPTPRRQDPKNSAAFLLR